MKPADNGIEAMFAKIYRWGSYTSISILLIGFVEMFFSEKMPKEEAFILSSHLKNISLSDYNLTFFIGLFILLVTPLFGLLYLVVAYFFSKKYKTALMTLLVLALFWVVLLTGFRN